MSVLKSKKFTIDGLSGSYVLAMDDLFRVQGVYKDGKIMNPASDEWTTAVLSDESKVIRATYKGVAGEAMSLVEDEVSAKFYTEESNKENNAEKQQALLENPTPTTFTPSLYGRSPTFASFTGRSYDRKSSSTMAYPIDIDTSQDHLIISKFQYKRTFINQSGSDDSSAGDFIGSIVLPMPKVSDSNGAEWGESDLNVFGVAGAEVFNLAAKLGQSSNIGDLVNTFKDFGTFTQAGLGANVKGGAAILGSVVATQALKTAGITVSPDELLARATGFVANPNAELLFQGPVLRDFGFSFLMIARSKPEGDMIRKIIKFLKEGAAPKYDSGNSALLGTPDLFRLRYSSKKLNFFHDMALRTITVDYAPDGYWAAYDDSQPIACVMNLQFTEIKPVYDKDHRKTAADSVGF